MHDKGLKDLPEMEAIASAANMPVADMLLEYVARLGGGVIAKSATPARIHHNAALTIGKLSDDVVRALDEYGAKHPVRWCNPNEWFAQPGPFFPAV